jgi:N-acetyl-1-D-myo-inositol-2-amino-2-deoxy-alpha-D-glucopyranoside deacetylase
MSATVLAVVAHPDDESLIAGGTLALAARAGAQVAIVSLTRGELGPIADAALATRETLADVREQELAAAGRILGATFTACLDLPDGELPWTDKGRAAGRLTALLDGRRPDVILTFDEDGLYWHADHIAAAEIAHRAASELGDIEVLEAVWSLATAPALAAAAREHGLPDSLWGIEPEAFGSDREPALSVDITPVLALKLEALRAHRTQLEAGNLLGELPLELAVDHLAYEHWAGRSAAKLKAVLAGG